MSIWTTRGVAAAYHAKASAAKLAPLLDAAMSDPDLRAWGARTGAIPEGVYDAAGRAWDRNTGLYIDLTKRDMSVSLASEDAVMIETMAGRKSKGSLYRITALPGAGRKRTFIGPDHDERSRAGNGSQQWVGIESGVFLAYSQQENTEKEYYFKVEKDPEGGYVVRTLGVGELDEAVGAARPDYTGTEAQVQYAAKIDKARVLARVREAQEDAEDQAADPRATHARYIADALAVILEASPGERRAAWWLDLAQIAESPYIEKVRGMVARFGLVVRGDSAPDSTGMERGLRRDGMTALSRFMARHSSGSYPIPGRESADDQDDAMAYAQGILALPFRPTLDVQQQRAATALEAIYRMGRRR